MENNKENMREAIINQGFTDFVKAIQDKGFREDETYTTQSVAKVVEEWYDKKQTLREIFRKHENWNEELQAVTTRVSITVCVSKNDARDCIRKAISSFGLEYGQRAYYTVLLFDSENISATISQREEEEIAKRFPELRITAGTRTTRAFGKIAKHIGIDKKEGYNQWYAKFCDALQEKERFETVIMSINPADFLLMSNGNSWSSCHIIGQGEYENGCYSAGTISYMLDEHSFISYTIKDGTNEEQFLQHKITRAVCAYSRQAETLYVARIYPSDNRISREFITNNVLDIVYSLEGIEDFELLNQDGVSSSYVDISYNALLYPDWKHGYGNLYGSKRVNNHETMILGTNNQICIYCGHTHDNTESVICCDCQDEGIYCHSCDTRYDRSDMCWVERLDEYYCDHCTVYCEAYDRHELEEDCYYVDGFGYIHADDVDSEDEVQRCDGCNELYYIDNTETDEEGNTYCDDCFHSKHTECIFCGTYVSNHEIVEIDGDEYCGGCAMQYQVEEIEEEQKAK